MPQFFKYSYVKKKISIWLETDRDKIKDNYTKIPNNVWTLLSSHSVSATEKTTFLLLYRLSTGWGKNTCSISYAKMVEYGMSRSTAIRTVKSLEKKGLIGKKIINEGMKGKEYNIYWINGGRWDVIVRKLVKGI